LGRRFEVRPWTAHYGLLSLPSEIKIGDRHDEMRFSVHPFANLFPLIEGADFTRLVTDIKENSLRESITTRDGRIIDCRNRYRACVAASIVPRTGILDIDDGELLAWILSRNLHRRHLTTAQRAAVAADPASLKPGSQTGKFAYLAFAG